MLDWIFEGIIGWVSGIISSLMDAVSGLFLEALGTDMTAMEEYFPFVTKAYGVMQVMAYAILILIVIWQLFRAFGGPINESENPWHLVIRGSIFGFLIGYAKSIFEFCLDIARAPYTSLMDISMTGEDFTFAGVEQTLTNGLTTIVAAASMVGLILILILLIALGWNYFKLLLETVERYIVVGVLCYTSPLAYSMGASKSTSNVFKSWCRMVGSQLLLLVMNVWFLRGFASSMGQFIGNGGALTTGKGSIFLWMFCALAYLKCAQRFDSYLGSIGLNVAQTGSSMGMELLMAARVITGAGGAAKSAGSVFSKGEATPTGTGAAATGFAAGFASRFNPNSYVRDAVLDGGTRMGFGGGAGFVARAFGGMAARNGATMNSQSVSSVASRSPNASGTIAGDIADRSLGNYMPHMKGFQLNGTQITGGHISTTATTADGKTANVDMYSASQYEKPDAPHSVVTAADGSQWYQMASGEGRGAFYDAPTFGGRAGQQNADGVDPNQDASHTDTGAQVPGRQTPQVQLCRMALKCAEQECIRAWIAPPQIRRVSFPIRPMVSSLTAVNSVEPKHLQTRQINPMCLRPRRCSPLAVASFRGLMASRMSRCMILPLTPVTFRQRVWYQEHRSPVQRKKLTEPESLPNRQKTGNSSFPRPSASRGAWHLIHLQLMRNSVTLLPYLSVEIRSLLR